MPGPNDTESTATDTWVTSQPKADATKLSSLPVAIADHLDGKGQPADEVRPDEGGQVLDEVAAAANRG